jgi:hypothetical protein
VGIIKLGVNFPYPFYPGIVERRDERKENAGA